MDINCIYIVSYDFEEENNNVRDYFRTAIKDKLSGKELTESTYCFGNIDTFEKFMCTIEKLLLEAYKNNTSTPKQNDTVLLFCSSKQVDFNATNDYDIYGYELIKKIKSKIN